MTPMTVYDLSSRVIWRPTIARSPPKRRRQSASLRITTFGPLSRSSDSWKFRPRLGDTPNTLK